MARNVDGYVSLFAVNGSVRAREITGLDGAEVSHGEINITIPAIDSDTSVTVTTGSITAALAPDLDATVTASTTNGDITANGLPLDASGSIKYTLGLPNSRLEYFVGKYISRTAVAVAAVVLGTLVGFVVAAATFTNGADPGRFLIFAGVSAVYALTISGIFVGLSAMTASRSRAMFAVLVVYFVIALFWSGFLPFLNLRTLIDTVSSIVGVTVSEQTFRLIEMLSPMNAYHQTTAEVYTGVHGQYEALSVSGPESDWLARQTWFCLLVMVAWATVVPVIGYLKFRRSELV